MKELVAIVEAADSGWAVAAIFIVGIYVILWKYGKEIILVLRDNRDETKNISESIITNHGSSNLGDAIDRLTENVGTIKTDLQTHQAELVELKDVLTDHLEESKVAILDGAVVKAKFEQHLLENRSE